MVNRYDNPAQAEFINTYVPIPFEQLYTLGKQAKENVDQALKDYSTALDKWAEFQSPSAADTKHTMMKLMVELCLWLKNCLKT